MGPATFATVTVAPAGHSFSVAPGQSVLEAALGAGLNFPYGCTNGTCGLCAARVLEGELVRTGHQDFVFDAAERAQNQALLCCHSTASDLRIEIAEASTPADIPHQDMSARVGKVSAPAPEVVIAELRCSRAAAFRYMSGQSLQLSAGALSSVVSVASCPCEEPMLRIHLDRRDVPELAESLVASRRGTTVGVSGPYGEFHLREDTLARERPVIMVGSGVEAGVMQAMANQLVNVDHRGAVRMLWVSDAGCERYAYGSLRAYADALDDASVEMVTPGPMVSEHDADSQVAALLRGLAVEQVDVYLAGDRAGLNASLFMRAGVASARVFAAG